MTSTPDEPLATTRGENLLARGEPCWVTAFPRGMSVVHDEPGVRLDLAWSGFVGLAVEDPGDGGDGLVRLALEARPARWPPSARTCIDLDETVLCLLGLRTGPAGREVVEIAHHATAPRLAVAGEPLFERVRDELLRRGGPGA